jgi:hypothetical protein
MKARQYVVKINMGTKAHLMYIPREFLSCINNGITQKTPIDTMHEYRIDLFVMKNVIVREYN